MAVALWRATFYYFGGLESSPTSDAAAPGTTALNARDGYLTPVANWPVRVVLAAVQTTATNL